MARESINVTPGRVRAQAAKERTYVPYNMRPDQVGTRTGKVMPSNVPRTSTGFEDPEAFFRSPNTTADSRSISMALSRTPGGGPESSPSGTTNYNTPGAQSSGGRSRATTRAGARSEAGSVGFQTPVASRGKGRKMSDLQGDDDDDEAAIGADLLLDDEFDGPSHFSSGSTSTARCLYGKAEYWLTTAEAPSVVLPRSSRLPPASPSVAYDSLPSPSTVSPSKRRRTGRAATTSESPQRPKRSALGQTSSALARVTRTEEVDVSIAYDDDVPGGDISMNGDADITADNLDMSPSEDEQMDEGTSFATTAASSKRRPGRPSTVAGNGDDDDDDREDEDADEEDDRSGDLSRSVRGRKSTASRRTTVAGSEQEYGTTDGGDMSTRYEQDMGGNDDYDMADQDDTNGAGGGYDNGDGDGDGEGDLDSRAGDEEDEDLEMDGRGMDVDGPNPEEDEEMGIEGDPAPREKTKIKTVRGKVGRPKVQKLPRDGRSVERTQPAEKKRMRLSRIGEETEDGYSGDFTTRRSARRHIKPLAYWRGEKVTYRSGDYIAELDEIVRVPVEPAAPLAARYKKTAVARGRGRSRSVATRGGEEDDSDAADDTQTNPTGVVQDYTTNKELNRRIVLPESRLEVKDVPGCKFQYQKVFGEEQFIASGVVYIPVGGDKPAKFSKDNSYVFFVHYGEVVVQVHRTTFVVCSGGQFMVPRGNKYTIKNASKTKTAKLFFAQARKLRQNEAETEALQRINESLQQESADSQAGVSRNGSAAPRDTKKAVKGGAKGSRRSASAQSAGEDEDDDEGDRTPKPKSKNGRRLAA